MLNLMSSLVLDPACDRSDGDPGLQIKGGGTLNVEVPHPQAIAKAEIYTFVCPSDLIDSMNQSQTPIILAFRL